MTQLELHELTGISQGYIADLENNKIKNPTDKTLEKIGAVLGFKKVDVEKYRLSDLLDTSNVELYSNYPITPEEVITLPIVGVVRAGQPILAMENIEGYYPVIKGFISKDKEYFYLRVKGDSMNIEFKEGSLLLVEKTETVENGEIAVVLIDGLEATVKKIVKNNDIITLIPMSSNPEYTPRIYNIIEDQVKIIGKIKQAIKIY